MKYNLLLTNAKVTFNTTRTTVNNTQVSYSFYNYDMGCSL